MPSHALRILTHPINTGAALMGGIRSLASNFSSPSKLIGGGKDGGSPASVSHEGQHDGMGEGHVIGHFEMLLFDMEKVVLATSMKTEERKKGRGEAVSDAVRVTLSLEASAVSSAVVSTTGTGTSATAAAAATTAGQKPPMTGALTAANLAPVIAAGKQPDGKKDDKTVNNTGSLVPPVASVLLRSLTVVNCYVSPAGPESSSSSIAAAANPAAGKNSPGEGVGSGGDKTKGKGSEANQPTSSTVTT